MILMSCMYVDHILATLDLSITLASFLSIGLSVLVVRVTECLKQGLAKWYNAMQVRDFAA
jgi:hypothetical protein